MISTKVLFGALTAACVMAGFSAAATAAVYSDNFESDTVGSAPVGWTSSNTSVTAGLTLNTVVDPLFNGGSNANNQAMDANQTAGTSSGSVWATGTFPSTVSLSDGDSISLSFDIDLASTPTALDRKFRFGLYNSASTGTPTPAGYIARLDTGADVASSTADLWASLGALGATSAQGSASLATTTNTGFQLSSTGTVYNISLTLTRSGTSIVSMLSMGINGGTPVTITGTDKSSAVLADTNYGFNEIFIGQDGGAALDYHIDNVNAVYTAAAPEPASLGVLGMGAVALLSRRRKA